MVLSPSPSPPLVYLNPITPVEGGGLEAFRRGGMKAAIFFLIREMKEKKWRIENERGKKKRKGSVDFFLHRSLFSLPFPPFDNSIIHGLMYN